jgi:hypothetical protein
MIKRYLFRLYDSILSRGHVEIKDLVVDDHIRKRGTISGQLKFHDGSLLDFDEIITLRKNQIVKRRYAYHYQTESGELIFRYDNLPHYPHIETHPHHKHVGAEVLPAQAPDLNDVLREIEQLIY